MTSFTDSRATGQQTFSIEQAKHELKAITEAHKQALEAEQRRHDLEEQSKDNAQRRMIINAVGIAVLHVLVVSFLIATRSANGTTRVWSQGLVSTIAGGIVGAAAGYLTGKRSQ